MRNILIGTGILLLISYVGINTTSKKPEVILIQDSGQAQTKQFLLNASEPNIKGKIVDVEVDGSLSEGQGDLTLVIRDRFDYSYDCSSPVCRRLREGTNGRTEIVLKNIHFNESGRAQSMNKSITQTLESDTGQNLSRDLSHVAVYLQASPKPGMKSSIIFTLPGQSDFPRADSQYYVEIKPQTPQTL